MNEEMFETSMVVAIKSLAVDVQFAIYELGLLLSFYRTLQTMYNFTFPKWDLCLKQCLIRMKIVRSI